MTVVFRIIDTTEVGRAHAWHSGFAAANDAIFPRSRENFVDLVLDRCAWCAITDEDEILGMAYACVSPDDREVEIGGVMVAAKTRGRGIGDILMRLPLAHFIVNERPMLWTTPPSIVAHVLEGNDKPRRIIERAGFVHHQSVKIPSAVLPGLRTGSDGQVHGDEFRLKTPDALLGLADWLESWGGRLRDGSDATISLLEGESLLDWATALRSIA